MRDSVIVHRPDATAGELVLLFHGVGSTLLAGRVVSIARRFAALPESVPASSAFHFIHGAQDQVIPAQHAVEAAQALGRLGATATLDVVPGLGHGVDARVASILVEHLKKASHNRQEQ